MSGVARKRVLIAGTFDVANYGDLLFPLTANLRLNPHGIDVVPVSPAGTPTIFADALPAMPVAEMLAGADPIDGVLIGGGYIVHNRRFNFLGEYQDGDMSDWAYAGLWVGATLAGAIFDVPIMWNAPGVLFPFPRQVQERLVGAVLRTADYVSVRDRGSAELLGRHEGVDIAVVPDTAVDLVRLWPRDRLTEPFRALLRRKSAPIYGNFMAVHLRARSFGEAGLPEIAGWIGEFASAQALTPILVAIGPSLGDSANARTLAGHLDCPHVLLDDPRSLIEIAAAIACSQLYIGASFHGYVTAAAYGRSGVVIARPAYKKFSGFLAQTGRPQDLAHDWKEALDIAARLLGEGPAERLPQSIRDAADRHWQRIAAALANPARGRAARGRFLREYLRYGAAAAGPAWVFRPALPNRRETAPAADRLVASVMS